MKRRAYESSGVDELWIVDPELETVRVYRRGDGAESGFARSEELAAERGDTLRSPLLPGLALAVGEVFARPNG